MTTILYEKGVFLADSRQTTYDKKNNIKSVDYCDDKLIRVENYPIILGAAGDAQAIKDFVTYLTAEVVNTNILQVILHSFRGRSDFSAIIHSEISTAPEAFVFKPESNYVSAVTTKAGIGSGYIFASRVLLEGGNLVQAMGAAYNYDPNTGGPRYVMHNSIEKPRVFEELMSDRSIMFSDSLYSVFSVK